MNCGEYPEDKSIPIVNEGFRFETSTDGSGRVVCENVVFIGGRLYACDAKLIQPVIKALEEERESIRTEAHRLLREKTEQFIEMSKEIERLNKLLNIICKDMESILEGEETTEFMIGRLDKHVNYIRNELKIS